MGFFDDLAKDFCRHLEMKGAIEASRDEDGKIDVAKATGISMGLGNTSLDDMAVMGSMLGAEGAFDDDITTDYIDDLSSGEISIGALSADSNSSFEDTFIGINLVSADDMELLSNAGYDEFDLDLIDSSELKEAMEDAGVDTDFYDFDE